MMPVNPAAGLSGTTRKLVGFLALLLIGCDLLLALLHHFLYAYAPYPGFFASLWDLNSECNIPAWYASVCWFCVALSAVACYLAERRSGSLSRWSLLWLVIALAFVVASADETGQIHEHLGLFLQDKLERSSLGPFVHQPTPDSPWLPFYLPPLGIFGAMSLAFLWRKLCRWRLLPWFFVLAGLCYVIALALEYYQGLPAETCRSIAEGLHVEVRHLLNAAVVVEETTENLGCSLLIMAFSAYACQLLTAGQPGPSNRPQSDDSPG